MKPDSPNAIHFFFLCYYYDRSSIVIVNLYTSSKYFAKVEYPTPPTRPLPLGRVLIFWNASLQRA